MTDKPVVVGIAQHGVVKAPERLVTYALGSCVGICLYDSRNKIAGMGHILLPKSSDAIERNNPDKFADSGCEALLRHMLSVGAQRRYVTAKIVGGATMFAVRGSLEGIGERNVRAVKEALAAMQVRLTAEDTGADYGRTVMMDAVNGKLTVHTVGHGTIEL